MVDQNSQFFAILTNVGAAKQANADALGIPWKITQMGVGDANGVDPTPSATQTRLINEWRRAPLNQLKVDDKDAKIVQNRNELWETMASTPKMVAFITGDEHAYARLYVDDNTSVGIKTKSDGSTAVFKHPVWQVTSGGAGAPWYDKQINLPWSPNLVRHSTQPHYAYFDVQPDSVKLEAYSQTGERLDSDVLWKDGAATGK